MNTNELSFDELNKVAGGIIKQPTKPTIPPTTGPTLPTFPAGPFDPHPLPYPIRH
jgi:hypothetical protein